MYPLVSICVPIYGVEKYIKRCVVSLMEQSYDNIEYIFVNDCTKDNSIVILKNTISNYPERKDCVTIINHEKNRGLAAARNTAIEASKGEFVVHVDSDDWLEHNAIDLMVSKQHADDSDIVFSSGNRIYPQYNEQVKYPIINSPKELNLKLLRMEYNLYIWGKLIRRSLYIDNEIRVREGINMGEDMQVLPQLLYASKVISVIPDVVYNYDCTNLNAYTSRFNVEKDKQDWQSLFILKDFIDGLRDVEYSDALQVGSLKLLVRCQMAATTIGAKDYYKELKERQKKIDRKYRKHIPLRDKLPLFVNNYFVVKYYVSIMGAIKHKAQELHSRIK